MIISMFGINLHGIIISYFRMACNKVFSCERFIINHYDTEMYQKKKNNKLSIQLLNSVIKENRYVDKLQCKERKE